MNETPKNAIVVHVRNVRLQPAAPVKARMGDLIMGPQVALHATKAK
jgi:hypothetical protein